MKKIVIFTILVLFLGVIAMYSCIINSKRIEQEKLKDNVAEIEQEEIQENIIEENEVESIEEKKENQELMQKEIEDQEQKHKLTTKNDTSNKTTSANKKESSKVETKKQEVKNTEIQAKQEQPKEESIQTTIQDTKSNNVITTKKEELKRNDKMIEKIRNVIKNNETEDMKNFGYQIVVDSSIKGITNQFTYSESRVINYLRNKFGTIRIYAEDYYCNGEFIMTECYII